MSSFSSLISPAETDTPLELGMSFVCDFNKSEHFIGRDAIFHEKRLVQFLQEAPETLLSRMNRFYGMAR